MTTISDIVRPLGVHEDHGRMLAGLASSLFLMMFEIYMVAPLISELSQEFGEKGGSMTFMIPAATIFLGIGSLFSGFLPVGLNIRALTIITLFLLTLSAFTLAICQLPSGLLIVRSIFGLSLGCLLPLTLRFIVRNYPTGKRTKPIMIIVFSMAGGMTFGPIVGALFYTTIGWRMEFIALGIMSLALIPVIQHQVPKHPGHQFRSANMARATSHPLAKTPTSIKLLTYSFILLNGIFHSGLFVWTCQSLSERYHPGPVSTALLLLDFGLPGLLLAVISALITKGNSVWKPELIGLSILAGCIAVLLLKMPSTVTLSIIMLLSIGYNITQPLFFGPLAPLEQHKDNESPLRIGCCCLFIGYGLGPILFQRLMHFGDFSTVLMLVFLIACLAAISKIIFTDLEK